MIKKKRTKTKARWDNPKAKKQAKRYKSWEKYLSKYYK